MKIDIIPVRGQDYDYFQVVLVLADERQVVLADHCSTFSDAAAFVRFLHMAVTDFTQQFSAVQS